MARENTQLPEKFIGRNIYSISRLDSFHNCEYGYYNCYVLKDRGRDNIYSVLGTVVHSIMEDLILNKITNEQALEKFDLEVFELMQIQGYKFVSEKVENNFLNCVRHYFKNFKPMKIKRADIEKEFYTEIGNVVMLGYIDLVAVTEDDKIIVLDHKTSTKYTGKDVAKHGRQLVLYAMALENEFGIKVSAIMWNMIKYCWVNWQGATKPRKVLALRTEIVKAVQSEIKKDLQGLGYSEFEIDLLMERALEENDMTIFDKPIQDKYTITDGYIEFPLTDENRNELENYLVDTVKEIEGRTDNEKDWKAKELTQQTSFFCSNLCNNRHTCKYYKEFLNELDLDLPKKKDELKDLFG